MIEGTLIKKPENGEDGIIAGQDGNRYRVGADASEYFSSLIERTQVRFLPKEGRAYNVAAVHSGKRRYINKPSLKTLWTATDGRVPLRDYWLRYLLPVIALGIAAIYIDVALLGKYYEIGPFTMSALAPVLWGGLVIGMKRCMDMDMHPAVVLLTFVPVVNIFIGLLLAVSGGTVGANRYGADPLEDVLNLPGTDGQPVKRVS